jgi:ribosomal protein S18 acetylase RimI-like enzyme
MEIIMIVKDDEIVPYLASIMMLVERVLKDENFTMSTFWKENREGYYFVLSFIEGKLLGFISYIEYTTFVYLMAIGVENEYQGKGYARRMMEEMKRRTVKEIWCKISKENEVSKRFFIGLGYEKMRCKDIPGELTSTRGLGYSPYRYERRIDLGKDFHFYKKMDIEIPIRFFDLEKPTK